jgi:DNA-binding CsgD family transcriptional regulator
MELLPIVDALYDGVADVAAWPRALNALCEVVGGHHAVAVVDGGSAAPPFVASARVDPAHLNRFACRWPEMAAWAPCFPVGAAIDFQIIVPSEVVARSDFYQDVIRPMEGYRAVMSVPFRDDSLFGFLAICRPARAADYEAGEVAQVNQVLPHLARALRARHESESERHRADATLEAMDRIEIAVAIVDAELRPVVLSRAAAAIVARGDGLLASRRRLAGGNAEQTRQLAALVRQATTDDPRVSGAYYMRLERPAHPAWSVTVRRLPGRGRLAAAKPLAMLLLDDTTRTPVEMAPVAAKMFDLTRREAAVAAQLADGQDLAAAAAALGITVGTARNHLKSLFHKTDTHRQAELVGLLLRLTRFSR